MFFNICYKLPSVGLVLLDSCCKVVARKGFSGGEMKDDGRIAHPIPEGFDTSGLPRVEWRGMKGSIIHDFRTAPSRLLAGSEAAPQSPDTQPDATTQQQAPADSGSYGGSDNEDHPV